MIYILCIIAIFVLVIIVILIKELKTVIDIYRHLKMRRKFTSSIKRGLKDRGKYINLTKEDKK